MDRINALKSRVRTQLVAFKALHRAWLFYKSWRLKSMHATAMARLGPIVRNGPFKGLAYLEQSKGTTWLNRILGTYEAGLHPVLESLLQNPYDVVINIGCAEGYYAVGLSTLCPDVPVFAFDSNPEARFACSTLAQLNDRSHKIKVFGACTPDLLASALKGRCLVVCDCEGYEADLFTSQLLNRLEYCDLIVELHPWIHSDISDVLQTRFRTTHSFRMIHQTPFRPRPKDVSVFHWFDRPLATYEERGGARGMWAVFLSKAVVHLSCQADGEITAPVGYRQSA